MALQANTYIETTDHSRFKYEVNRPLVFREYVRWEIAGETFRAGDLLLPLERNACGMGIDVRRFSDGAIDMVWPEEVDFL